MKDMKNQMNVSVWRDELVQLRTNKKEFLEQMERLIPWGEWKAIIEPCYYKGERGNKPYDLELMLRLFVVQNLYSLSDMATRDEAIDSRAFSRSAGRTGRDRFLTVTRLGVSGVCWKNTGYRKSSSRRSESF